MTEPAARAARIFKTARFARAARKAHIDDDELCKAIRQIMNGQAADLGGGVFKKRLNKNMHLIQLHLPLLTQRGCVLIH